MPHNRRRYFDPKPEENGEDEKEGSVERGASLHNRRNSSPNLTEAQEFFYDELADMKTVQTELKDAVNGQVTETRRLNDTIKNLSDNLDKGFRLLGVGAKLARMVVWAFIFVIVVLGAIIVYITQVDINVFGGTISPKAHTINIQEKEAPSPPKVPSDNAPNHN